MLNDTALDTLFYAARTHNGWQDRDVSNAQLEHLFDLLKWGPTAANGSPARLVFVKSPEAREKLAACVSAGDAAAWFVGNEALIASTAFRNSSLQGGYLIMAARAIGLDCGPMSGFDEAKVNQAFFAGTSVKANFICSIGYGEPAKLRPRAPRLSFAEACSIV